MKHVHEALQSLLGNIPQTEMRAPQTPRVPTTTAEWENSPDLAPFITFDDPELLRMRTAAARFLSDMVMQKEPRWLSLLGPSGTGKTFLADLIYQAVRDRRLTQRTVQFDGLLIDAHWRTIFEIDLERRLADGEWDFFVRACSAKFTLVDEVLHDLVPATVSGPKLASLAERRIGKWTVLTANVSLQAIKERRDARVASRMIRGGNVVIDVDTIDFNLR